MSVEQECTRKKGSILHLALTLFAVSFDNARLLRFGVVYHCCPSLESVPLLFAFSPDEDSFRFTLRAVFTCSGVGVACIDGTAVFFKISLEEKPANFAPNPS